MVNRRTPIQRITPTPSDQRGFTLVELLLAMTMALVVAGSGFTLISTAENRNRANALRADSLNATQVKLERMMREFRQAEWLVFRSSNLVDLHVPVDTGSGTSVARHVRYDCSTGTVCVRQEGPATTYPPPANPPVDTTDNSFFVGLTPGPVFRPQDVSETTGDPVTDFVTPTAVEITLAVTVEGWEDPMRLEDGVSLRNATSFGT